jgi:hypothetical protein
MARQSKSESLIEGLLDETPQEAPQTSAQAHQAIQKVNGVWCVCLPLDNPGDWGKFESKAGPRLEIASHYAGEIGKFHGVPVNAYRVGFNVPRTKDAIQALKPIIDELAS